MTWFNGRVDKGVCKIRYKLSHPNWRPRATAQSGRSGFQSLLWKIKTKAERYVKTCLLESICGTTTGDQVTVFRSVILWFKLQYTTLSRSKDNPRKLPILTDWNKSLMPDTKKSSLLFSFRHICSARVQLVILSSRLNQMSTFISCKRVLNRAILSIYTTRTNSKTVLGPSTCFLAKIK